MRARAGSIVRAEAFLGCPALARVRGGQTPSFPQTFLPSVQADSATAFKSNQEGAAQGSVNQDYPLTKARAAGDVPGSVPASSWTEKGKRHPAFGVRSLSVLNP